MTEDDRYSHLDKEDAAKAEQQRNTNRGCLIVAVAVIAIIGFCSFSGSNDNDDQSEDTMGVAACEHFRNVASDAGQGLLNDPEIREKMREVHDTGESADSPAVRTASRDLLSSTTSGDVDAFLAAIADMDRACTAVGA